jgi:hypothetical protein
MLWGHGRAACRDGFAEEGALLFQLATQVAGRRAYNGPLSLRLSYRLMPPYAAERMSESVKSVLRFRSR